MGYSINIVLLLVINLLATDLGITLYKRLKPTIFLSFPHFSWRNSQCFHQFSWWNPDGSVPISHDFSSLNHGFFMVFGTNFPSINSVAVGAAKNHRNSTRPAAFWMWMLEGSSHARSSFGRVRSMVSMWVGLWWKDGYKIKKSIGILWYIFVIHINCIYIYIYCINMVYIYIYLWCIYIYIYIYVRGYPQSLKIWCVYIYM